MQEGILTLAGEHAVQNLLWSVSRHGGTVLLVDEQRRAYKRAFAATLLGARAGHGSQRTLAKIAETSEATYRRWEDPDHESLPDAWQVALIAKHVGEPPGALICPEELSPREWELTRRSARATARALTQSLRDGGAPS